MHTEVIECRNPQWEGGCNLNMLFKGAKGKQHECNAALPVFHSENTALHYSLSTLQALRWPLHNRGDTKRYQILHIFPLRNAIFKFLILSVTPATCWCLVLMCHPEDKWSQMIWWLCFTCSLVSLDFLQACESPQGSAFFEGHHRYHVLLIGQRHLWGLSPHWQFDDIFYHAIVHRLCVFLWLGFMWQVLRWYRSLFRENESL